MTRPPCRVMETRLCPALTPCPEGVCARFESDDPGPWLDEDGQRDEVTGRMSGPHDTRLAKLAYRAHNRVLNADDQLPQWDDLPTRVQTAWEVAAYAIWCAALRTLKGGEAGH